VLRQVVLASILVFATTILHAGCTVIAFRTLAFVHSGHRRLPPHASGVISIAALVMMMSLVALLESLLWALAYVGVGAIAGLEKALYFSIVTFTTLGYGDVVMDESWRLLAALEAANGIIIFGWTTALIFAFVQRVYSRVKSSKNGHGRTSGR
jgi:voltage-gated potassium channel Kch